MLILYLWYQRFLPFYKGLLNKSSNFANEYVNILKSDINLYTMQGNHYCLMAPIPGLRSKEVFFNMTVDAYDGTKVG